MSSRRSAAWDQLMAVRGLQSYRRLGDAAGISHEAARRVVLGMASDEQSVRAVAAALSVDVELVHEMRGEPASDERAWEPPPAARLLTDDERAALSRLIGVMTVGRDREEVVGDGNTAPTSTPNPHPLAPAPLRRRPLTQADLDAGRAAARPMPPGGSMKQQLDRAQDEDAYAPDPDPGDEPA